MLSTETRNFRRIDNRCSVLSFMSIMDIQETFVASLSDVSRKFVRIVYRCFAKSATLRRFPGGRHIDNRGARPPNAPSQERAAGSRRVPVECCSPTWQSQGAPEYLSLGGGGRCEVDGDPRVP